MARRRFEFPMPATPEVVFDAFHHRRWRARWDSLVGNTHVEGGAPCPSVGAVTQNIGAGIMRGLTMRTRFVSFDRPRVAAATMVGTSFPFERWAASMQHRADTARAGSLLVYTYNFDVAGGLVSRRLLEPVVRWIFDWQTRRRFARLRRFLARHARDVEAWQRDGSPP